MIKAKKEFFHQIAGIEFVTISDIALPRLNDQWFHLFKSNASLHDIKNYIYRVERTQDPEPFKNDRYSNEDDQAGTSGRLPESNTISSNDNFLSILTPFLADGDKIELMIDRDYAIIRNFSRSEFHLFFMDTLGGFNLKTQRYTPEFQIAGKLRYIFSSFLNNHSAIMVHSSGIAINNRAALFIAPSNGGKTTVARHFSKQHVLNDDQVILRKRSQRVMANATPLGSMTAGPCSVELGGLFVLEKSDHFELNRLDKMAAITSMWSALPQDFQFYPIENRTRSFQFLYDICRNTPCYRMKFSRDYVDFDAVDHVMKKSNRL